MTVEVYLFENKTESKPSYDQVKAIIDKSPNNRSVEHVYKQTDRSLDRKNGVPVYQKYIKQLKKVGGGAGNLKDLHKKMHSSIMNSFIVPSDQVSLSKPTKMHKNSSSFIFGTKSPLSTAKSTSSKHIGVKARYHKHGNSSVEPGHKRKSSRSKGTKRSGSKKSIGGASKKSSYSTTKLKDSLNSTKCKNKSNCHFSSLMSQRFKNMEAVKYNSFVGSCKISPTRTKSNEKVPKKSQRKLDLNTIRAGAGCRKKSYGGMTSAKSSVPSSITSTVKKQPKDYTRNIPKMEEFEPKTHYPNIMNSYSEVMSTKRKAMKK